MAVQRPRRRGRPWRPLLAALGQGFSLLHSVAQPVFKGGCVSTPHDGGGCTVRAQLWQRSWWFLLAAPVQGAQRAAVGGAAGAQGQRRARVRCAARRVRDGGHAVGYSIISSEGGLSGRSLPCLVKELTCCT